MTIITRAIYCDFMKLIIAAYSPKSIGFELSGKRRRKQPGSPGSKVSFVKMSVLRSLPKIELHAHLSGSLSASTIKTLLEKRRVLNPEEIFPESVNVFLNDDHDISKRWTFDGAFSFFAAAQLLLDNPYAVAFATNQVLDEFSSENVKYIEIRTTPRFVHEKMTKEQHISTIIEGSNRSRYSL